MMTMMMMMMIIMMMMIPFLYSVLSSLHVDTHIANEHDPSASPINTLNHV